MTAGPPTIDEAVLEGPEEGARRSLESDTRGVSARARSAVLWNTAFNLYRDLMQFATMLILVRHVGPSSYGEFGLTNSVIGFLTVFSFALFASHSLQVQDERDTLYQEHFTAGAFLNGALFLIANGLAVGMRWTETYSAVSPYVHALSITFLLEWPCEIRRKMLERQLDWRRLRLLHASGILASAILAVTLALLGAGTWALLLPGLLVTVPFIIDLFVVEGWRPTWRWSWAEYRPAFVFGTTRIAGSLAGNGRSLLESSVLSVALGFGGFGVYTRALGLAQMFCSKTTTQLMYAVYPVLTRVEKHGGDPVRTGNLILRFVAWTSIPTAAVLGMIAAPFVRLLYGRAWDAVIPLLPFTLALAVLGAALAAATNLLLARQQAMRCFSIELIYLAGTGLALVFALRVGTVPYVLALIAVLVFELFLLLYWLTVFGGASWRGAAEALVPPIVVSAAAMAALQFAQSMVHLASPFVAAALVAVLFGLIYAAGLRLVFRTQLEGIINHLPAAHHLRRLLLLHPA